jgi:hypothetical protein
MIVFILLCIIVLFINLYIGLHVLFLNPKHKTNITFFLMTMILSFLTLGSILFQLFENEAQILLLYKHGTSISVFITPLAVIIALQLSKLVRFRSIYYFLILIPAIAIAVKNSLTSPYTSFIRYENSWRLFSIEGDSLAPFIPRFVQLRAERTAERTLLPL